MSEDMVEECVYNDSIALWYYKNAECFKIDLDVKDYFGTTGFKFALQNKETEVIDLIKRKIPSIAVI